MAHGRAASKPVTFEPITTVVHPYQNKAVACAPWTFTFALPDALLPFHLFVIPFHCTNAALSHISSNLYVALNNTEVVSVKQVTLANNLNMPHLWRELYNRLIWLTIWLFMYSWLPLYCRVSHRNFIAWLMSCFSNQHSSSGETEDEFKHCDSFWLISSPHLLTPHQVLSKVP